MNSLPTIIAQATAVNAGEQYKTYLENSRHHLIADEPTQQGGADLGPSPGDYLCMALASCTAITLRMYTGRKAWEVGDITVSVNLVKGSEMPSGNNTFSCEIAFGKLLPAEQQKRLLEIAKACPIHRLLTKSSEVLTLLKPESLGA